MLTVHPAFPKVRRTMTTGRLYLVSLPIGNLEDITLRAIKTLRTVDFIVAEDTRTTRKLLTHYRIKPLFYRSYYQGVEQTRITPILEQLKRGKNLALVSEAGTPLISDPGYPLVKASIEAGIPVIPIPGPTAAVTALSASGLPTARFSFDGALPRKIGDRRTYFETIREETRTLIVHEAPHRLLSTLGILAEILPKRPVALARELTKAHEEFLRGTPQQLLDTLGSREKIKGECVLLIGGAPKEETVSTREAAEALVYLLKEEKIPTKLALRILMCCLDLPRNTAYKLLHSS
jgi:16S rRNA (cytidine1402-2'-O)-methyltransferase